MEEKNKKALELFTKKADKLKSSNFIKSMLDEEKLTRRMIEGTSLGVIGPDDESRDAFLLTFRLFFQDGDGFSIRYLDEEVSKDPALSENWKKGVSGVRDWLKRYLDKPSLLNVRGALPTNRDVFNVLLYGDLAHTSTDKKRGVFGRSPREQFELWEQEDGVFYFYQLELDTIIFDIYHVIMYISEISKKEIE